VNPFNEQLAVKPGRVSYRGRPGVMATRHRKERAVAPAFASGLGLVLAAPEDLDTDRLGTFTGEIPRTGNMRETARRKAMMGLEATGLSIAVASEGSFGSHPSMPFLPLGREVLIFVDTENGIEVVEEQVSERTNFAAIHMTDGAELDGFLLRAGFPRHAIVLRGGDRIVRGITSRGHLDRLLQETGGPLHLETDMRAHMNPTRMGEIARLAERLARRIATPCPACEAPGFGLTGSERGLPCECCGSETSLVRALLSSCACCGHMVRDPRADRRVAASPSECPECNP